MWDKSVRLTKICLWGMSEHLSGTRMYKNVNIGGGGSLCAANDLCCALLLSKRRALHDTDSLNATTIKTL